MTAEQLVSLGWQLAGWLLALVMPAAAIYGIRYLQEHTSDTRYQLLRSLAADAVTAVEQTLKNKSNYDKQQAALKFVQDCLDARGIHWPVSVIVGAVESAVFTELDHTPTPLAVDSAAPKA